MSPDTFFLAVDPQCWRLVRLPRDGDLDLCEVEISDSVEAEATDEAIAEALRSWDYAGQPTCVGLPSEMVFSCSVDCSELPRRERGTAMLYRLEEQLPVDAEILTASFTPAVGGRALGLAVETGPVRALVERLEHLGVEVAAICPTALLTFWELCRREPDGFDYVLISWGPRVDIVRAAGDFPAGWYASGPDEEELTRHIGADLLTHPVADGPPSVRLAGGFPPSVVERLRSEVGVPTETEEVERPLEIAARAAKDVLSGRGPAWVDFRKDALAAGAPWKRVRKLLTSAASLSVLFFAALCATLVLRGMRYGAVARDGRQEQQRIHAKLYPGQPVPWNVRSRLRSELARLSGIRGVGLETPQRANALDSLHQIAASLPANVRLRILQIRVDRSGIYIEGQVRNHTDAEVIARALQRAGFRMSRPQTERLASQGVSFTLMGKLPEKGKKTASPPGLGGSS